jgi:hypothetical protein
MNKHQEPIHEMFRKVREFVRQHESIFTPGSNAHTVAARLDETIRELDEHISLQRFSDQASQKHTQDKSEACHELRSRLQLIVDVVRLLKRTIPDIGDRFKFGRSESDAALLHTARLFAEQAESLKPVFLKYEMPENFIEDIYSRIRTVEQLLADRTTARSALKRSTNNIRTQFQNGLHLIAELDIFMTNLLRDKPAERTHWNIVRRVRKVPRRKRAAAAAAGQDNAD